MLKAQSFPIAAIRVPAKRKRTLEAAKVDDLANDILENGQTTPIRVRADKDKDGFILVEGYHRLEALKALGEDEITGYVVQAQKF
ncbi:MAG: ParB N-terminal domain-containing protein [Pseudomonadota bacterium]